MFAGPIFSREVLTTPRHARHFLMRAGYVLAWFVLMYTAGQATFGWQQTTTIGEMSRFGSLLFQLFSVVQLALVLFFAPLFAASRVAQEKDRQTLILLLMTALRNRELVLGKLLASLLPVGVLLAAATPVFTGIYLLGGTTLSQIVWSVALCAATAVAAGSWGSLVAFWREKTFQTLAISTLGLVLFLGVVEAGTLLFGVDSLVGSWMKLLDPFRGMLLVLDPLAAQSGLEIARVPAVRYCLAMLLLAVLFNGIAIWRLRVWNPPRGVFEAASAPAPAAKTVDAARPGTAVPAADSTVPPVAASVPATAVSAPVMAIEPAAASRRPTRRIWSNPVLWREICTKAYGRKMLAIKLAYVVLFLFGAVYVRQSELGDSGLVLGMISPPGFAFVALAFISVLLVNAQAVTALTTERDSRTLELLLVTDLTPKEFVLGKLGGVFYNTKETLLLPLLGLLYFVLQGHISWENLIYVGLGFLMLAGFAAMLGMHSGLTYDNSRSAIGNSLGTMFFLFLGIFVCMMLIVEARSSFMLQLPSFLIFILGGSLGLWASLTHKNPSPALTLSALLLPFFTFYAITGFLLNDTLGIWLVVTATYGFTTLAMLVPAISEFDMTLGRSTNDRA